MSVNDKVYWKITPKRVIAPYKLFITVVRSIFIESRCLGVQRQVGGTDLLKLNMGERPIANKYREGKMKSTWKRE